MSTPPDSSLFVDIADAIGLGNPAIIEKDYYVVQLLQLITSLKLEHHQIIFSGGTALAKSSIKTYRMSEDIDLKLVSTPSFNNLSSRGARREARKAVKQLIDKEIRQSSCFSTESSALVRDEYRYFRFNIRYPQAHQQAPCLRPFIKMEFTESELLSQPQKRDIQSIYSEVLKRADEVSGLYCASIIDTQAEKLLSMLRRTASLARDCERNDDKALIRHIYDTYHIQQIKPSDLNDLAPLFKKAMQADIEKFGNQHPQMLESPLRELRYGLQLLESDPTHSERYKDYVTPMVYAESPVEWQEAFKVFKELATAVLDEVETSTGSAG